MAQIVLIVPKGFRYPLYPHLGLLYLAAMVHENYSVRIIDGSVEPDVEAVLESCVDGGTLCAGITTMTGTQIGEGLKIAALLRRRSAGRLPIVWGGIHAALDPEGTLAHPLVDAVCCGEGELVFPALVGALAQGRDLRGVPGLGFKDRGAPVFTPAPAECFELDRLPLLPLHLVSFEPYNEINFFKAFSPPTHYVFGFKNRAVCGLETTRGCPYECTYCIRSVKREKLHSMSVGRVLEHIEHLRGAGVRSVEFVNDNFFCNPGWARELLGELKRRRLGIDFFLNVRDDFIARTDEGTLELMEEAGVLTVGIGAESGSDATLERIRKKATVADAFAANARLKKRRIMALFGFLGGFPEETLGDIVATYRAMYRITVGNPKSKVMFSKLFPNVNTPVYRQCVERGLPPRRGLEEWVDALDLAWRRRGTVYMRPEVERWIWSTQYFRDMITLMWILRSPYDCWQRRMLRAIAGLMFRAAYGCVLLRARFRWTGYGIDTLAGDVYRWLLRVSGINRGYNF